MCNIVTITRLTRRAMRSLTVSSTFMILHGPFFELVLRPDPTRSLRNQVYWWYQYRLVHSKIDHWHILISCRYSRLYPLHSFVSHCFLIMSVVTSSSIRAQQASGIAANPYRFSTIAIWNCFKLCPTTWKRSAVVNVFDTVRELIAGWSEFLAPLGITRRKGRLIPNISYESYL